MNELRDKVDHATSTFNGLPLYANVSVQSSKFLSAQAYTSQLITHADGWVVLGIGLVCVLG